MWSRDSPDTSEQTVKRRVNNSSLAAAIINHHLSSANQCQTPRPLQPDPFIPARIAFSRFLRPHVQSPESQVRRRRGHWGCPSKQTSSFYSHLVSLQSSHSITWDQMNSFIVATMSARSHQLTWAMWSYQTVGFFSFYSVYVSPELQISTFCISFRCTWFILWDRCFTCCTSGNAKRHRLLYFDPSQTTGRMWTLPSTATTSWWRRHCLRMKPWQMNHKLWWVGPEMNKTFSCWMNKASF